MGAWGVGIFDDDVASDIRDELEVLLAESDDAEAAASLMIERWRPDDGVDDLAMTFWIAMAAAQQEFGARTEGVRARALQLLEGEADIGSFAGGADQSERRKALSALARQLSAPPKQGRRPKKRGVANNRWSVGQLLFYTLPSGRLCLLEVTGHHIDKGGRFPIVAVLNWQGASGPAWWQKPFVGQKLSKEGWRTCVVLAGDDQALAPAFKLLESRRLVMVGGRDRFDRQLVVAMSRLDRLLEQYFGLS